jgi:HD-GYP domain-containing protein (c-di-GMP phosphodiesterase class II)
MTTELAQKLEGVRDFKKILETVVKELGETYSADVSQIVLSNPLDRNITSIYEHKLYPEANPDLLPVNRSFPLPLEGAGLGAITLARGTEFHENEVNWIRITLAELCDIIRHAQINDIVQRDTFRNTFLFEIQNVMNYSLGIGDALFMVVNILGKVLNSSRCLFICVDDTHAGWKCYEFWQRERVQSCQEYGWPTTDSPIVARSLLASSPLIIEEANQNSYLTPAQQELQLLGVRSLLGVPLRSENATHGCIILQHCDARHEWTRGEIDMVQNVADTVAESLAKLPEEKRGREPIMRLHQRELQDTAGDTKESMLAVRRALRNTLGQSSIPSAQKTSAPKPPVPTPAVQAPAPTPTPTPTPPPVQATPPAVAMKDPNSLPSMQPPAAELPPSATPPANAAPSDDVMQTIGQLANSLMNTASGDISAEEVSASLHSILGGMGKTSGGNETFPPQPAVGPPGAGVAPDQANPDAAWYMEPPADTGPATPMPTVETQVPLPGDKVSGSQPGPWGNDAATSPPPQAPAADSPWGDLDSIGVKSGGNGSASGVPSSAATAADGGNWGDLNSIPTPAAGSATAKGLSAMLGKRSNAPASPLMASLHRDKSKFQQQVEFVDGGEIQIDEAQAQAKLAKLMQSANPTSDYIFALDSLNPRIAGRVDGWISQVEAKDKYGSPHAIQVAEYSMAIARLLGLPNAEVDTIRLAGLCHDVGKIGLPANILQKDENDLEDNELLWIMKHPIDGATLLEGVPELSNLCQLVLAHHEEYDGNGYPAGLVGDQIPIGARIIHAASDYHKMISPSRTAPGMDKAQAQAVLRAGAGRTYDPAVVEALIACEQQGMVAAVR